MSECSQKYDAILNKTLKLFIAFKMAYSGLGEIKIF